MKPNWHNRTLFHGDNLKFLRSMNRESVDLIATDPPFNKGRDFHATPDSLAKGASFQDRWSWETDVHQEWVDHITDDHPNVMNVVHGSRSSYGDDMGAFLCFIAVRLLAMRRVLKPTGSIYLHCDPTASHYLKELMDAVFGRKNFRNEIVWHYQGWNKRLRNHIERRHDIILFYSQSKGSAFNYPTRPWGSKDEYIRVRKQRVRADENGREYVLSDAGGGKRVKRCLDDAMSYGVPLDDVWRIDKINNSDKIERVGYPTQKPLALYERIVLASSNKGDVVLDPFAGCATTCVAAERLGREWVGIDIWDNAHQTVVDRLRDEGELFGKVHYATEPPERTDDGETSAPFLRVKQAVREPHGPRMSRAEMYNILLSRQGPKCQGCDRKFDDPRYLELDHNTPRADGGINHISNRVLLCGPCNRAKSNVYTLSGLRRLNKKNEWMIRGGT